MAFSTAGNELIQINPVERAPRVSVSQNFSRPPYRKSPRLVKRQTDLANASSRAWVNLCRKLQRDGDCSWTVMNDRLFGPLVRWATGGNGTRCSSTSMTVGTRCIVHDGFNRAYSVQSTETGS